MKKNYIFLMLTLILGIALNANAQEVDSATTEQTSIVDSLSNELAELQHKYNYLDVVNQIVCAINETQIFCNEVLITVNSTKITIYHQGFDLDLYLSMVDNYDLSVKSFELLKMKVDNVKTLVTIRKLLSNFSETEIEIIDSNCKALDLALSKVEKSLEYNKRVLDIYKSLR